MEEPVTELGPTEVETRGTLEVIEVVEVVEVVEIDLEDDTALVTKALDKVLDAVAAVTELVGASVMLGYAEYIRRPALIVELALRSMIVSFR